MKDRRNANLKPIIPFEPVRIDQIPVGPSWIAQVKWDGVRMLSYYDGTKIRLVNRRLHDRTARYPELQHLNEHCHATSFILDGELVAFQDGKPSFYEIMKRDSLRSSRSIQHAATQIPIVYMVFDILFANDQWVTELPLIERQQLLSDLIRPQPYLHLVENFPDGQALFRAISNQGMEGVILKRVDSKYLIQGKDNRWQKHKISRDIYALIGGVTYRDKMVNSLLLGLMNTDGTLEYIGHAGTGKWGAADWRSLTAEVQKSVVEACPFRATPPLLRDTQWLHPQYVVKVSFLEWTPGGTMRHPVIEGLAPHVPAKDCTLQQE